MSLCTIVRVALFLPLAMSALAQPYTAQKTTADGIPVVRLNDNERGMVVSIAPTVGNNAYEMIVGAGTSSGFPTNPLQTSLASRSSAETPFSPRGQTAWTRKGSTSKAGAICWTNISAICSATATAFRSTVCFSFGLNGRSSSWKRPQRKRMSRVGSHSRGMRSCSVTSRSRIRSI